MDTQLPSNYTEAELLYHYLGEQMSAKGREASVVSLLQGYVQYRRELQSLREKLRQAEASTVRHEPTELDVEQLIAEVTEELALEGITE